MKMNKISNKWMRKMDKIMRENRMDNKIKIKTSPKNKNLNRIENTKNNLRNMMLLMEEKILILIIKF